MYKKTGVHTSRDTKSASVAFSMESRWSYIVLVALFSWYLLFYCIWYYIHCALSAIFVISIVVLSWTAGSVCRRKSWGARGLPCSEMVNRCSWVSYSISSSPSFAYGRVEYGSILPWRHSTAAEMKTRTAMALCRTSFGCWFIIDNALPFLHSASTCVCIGVSWQQVVR